jgi:teichuronic acid biosynthesis glycosyltransferase TuaG
MAFLEETKTNIVTSAYFRQTPNFQDVFYPPKTISEKDVLGGNPVSCLTTIFDRSLSDAIFFDESLLKAEDLLFWYEILKKEGPAKGNQIPLATYNIHKSSKSNNKIKLIKWQWTIYRKKLAIGFFKSLYLLMKWAVYGLKKYHGLRRR